MNVFLNFNNRVLLIRPLLFVLFLLPSCKKGHQFDASGAFEAEELVISSQAQGVLMKFDVEEGRSLTCGAVVGYVDSLAIFLKKEQLLAQLEVLASKKPNIPQQLAPLRQQLSAAKHERVRMEKLREAEGVTAKQLDDVNAQVEVLKKQIEAQKTMLETTVLSIDKEKKVLEIQLKQLDDLLNRCRIVNPVDGTVLTRYVRAGEITTVGKPLYRIADLRNIILRVYVTGDQLPRLILNQSVKVYTDDGAGGFLCSEGRIAWISDKAEFTPKTIRTKDERANLVYALKIQLKNDGKYKIGMYGEVDFD